jgi:pimeloyl-ACP methyl ester carboxylesterase
MFHPSTFRTPKGETAYLTAYSAAMKLWPGPYGEMDIPSRFGTTHVVVSGPEEAPALVLLHGYMATSAMWSPNIADFSNDYRLYAIDVMEGHWLGRGDSFLISKGNWCPDPVTTCVSANVESWTRGFSIS